MNCFCHSIDVFGGRFEVVAVAATADAWHSLSFYGSWVVLPDTLTAMHDCLVYSIKISFMTSFTRLIQLVGNAP